MSDGKAQVRRPSEHALVIAAAVVLTALYTWPIAAKPGHLARIDNGDAQFAIWNVAWVARTLPTDPVHVFDANIFYPERGTLVYSESNLGAGALAMPVYWATRNPYAAVNSVVLFAFVLSFVGAYYLVRYLTDDWRAAALSAIWFAFCPTIFTRIPHIQLLLVGGLPLAMLALHRIVDRPTAGRGAVLGVVMAAQALCCGYYGVFAIVMIGFAAAVLATTRGLWRTARFWMAMATGVAVAIALVAPAFVPYAVFQRTTGFRRSIQNSVQFSANWSSFLASPAYAHAWLLPHLPRWNDVLFPGVLVTLFAAASIATVRRDRNRELLILYGGLALLAFWISFGPAGGLYVILYKTVPLFTWLRVPTRIGIVINLALSVLGGVAAAAWFRRFRHPTVAFALVAVCACAELLVPSHMREVPPLEPVYVALKGQPSGPLIELPYFYLNYMYPRHTYYMLQSTNHWMPLVNGYSDFMPPDFIGNVATLGPFPTRESLRLLAARHVRYAIFHRYWYNHANWHDVSAKLEEFAPYLKPLYADERTRLYEIVGAPP